MKFRFGFVSQCELKIHSHLSFIRHELVGEFFSLHNHVKWVHIVELFSLCVKKRYESESVYSSESDYVDPPATYAIGRPSETIQNKAPTKTSVKFRFGFVSQCELKIHSHLMDKLIRIRGVSGSTSVHTKVYQFASVNAPANYRKCEWVLNSALK